MLPLQALTGLFLARATLLRFLAKRPKRLARGTWAVPSGLGIGIEVDPSPIFSEIVEIIEADTAAGNEDKIDHVGLTTLGGLQLALEGVLTKEILVAGEESADSIVVTVEFLGKPRKVVICSPDKDLPYGVATYDADGQVV